MVQVIRLEYLALHDGRDVGGPRRYSPADYVDQDVQPAQLG